MFDYINRFLDDPRPEIAASVRGALRRAGWNLRFTAGRDVKTPSSNSIENACVPRWIGSCHLDPNLEANTRQVIFLPGVRTGHFRDWWNFEESEKKAVEEQERVRLTAKQESREARTGQAELFAAAETPGVPATFEDERSYSSVGLGQATGSTRQKGLVAYEDALVPSGVAASLGERRQADDFGLRDAHEIDIVGLKPPERTPRKVTRSF